MSDLISREKALEEIEDWERCYTWDEHCRESKEDYIVSPSDVIVNLPSAQPEQQWIPCSEKLPNTNGIYIVTRRISDGFECRNITDACYFDGSNTWHDDTRVNHERKYLADVLAWMPLSTPWEGGQDEN